jgi:hypothetical protein
MTVMMERETFFKTIWVGDKKQESGFDPIMIRRVPMDIRLAHAWHGHVQPHINVEHSRADTGWSWPVIFWALQPYVYLNNWVVDAWTYLMPISGRRKALPVGMVYCIAGFPALQDHRRLSEYVWFLSVAPETALQAHGISRVPSLGKRIVLDALELSRADEHCNLGLHAAPRGGDALIRFYQKLGLINLPIGTRLPMKFRVNDGRYFYSEGVTTLDLLKESILSVWT